MRLPKRFSRFLGGGTDPNRQLGQAVDLAPNTAGSGSTPLSPTDGEAAPTDLILISRFANASAWPVQRIAVAYAYVGAGPAPAIAGVGLWLYDSKIGRWFRLPTTITLTADQFAFADVVALMDGGPRSAPTVLEPTAGSLEAWLAIPAPMGAPNGEYIFAYGPDLSVTV